MAQTVAVGLAVYSNLLLVLGGHMDSLSLRCWLIIKHSNQSGLIAKLSSSRSFEPLLDSSNLPVQIASFQSGPNGIAQLNRIELTQVPPSSCHPPSNKATFKSTSSCSSNNLSGRFLVMRSGSSLLHRSWKALNFEKKHPCHTSR
jgi:hypothetical protein